MKVMSALDHVHEQRFQGVVFMMGEGHLLAAVFLRRGVDRRLLHPRADRAGEVSLFLFMRFEDRIDFLRRFDMQSQTQRSGEFFHRLPIESREA